MSQIEGLLSGHIITKKMFMPYSHAKKRRKIHYSYNPKTYISALSDPQKVDEP